MKALAFDIEIAKIVPKGEDLDAHRPLGITVAATLTSDGISRVWYGQGRPGGDPMPQMPAAQAQVLVRYLGRMVSVGYTIVAWNGLGFDFRVLAEESGLHEECAELALNHIDPMWQFFCEKGWAIGLNAVAKGMAVGQKTEGVSGADAPLMWAEGRYQEVMDYCAQDVKVTLDIYCAIQERGKVVWLSKRGHRNAWVPQSKRLLTVRQAMEIPEPPPPDWLQDPWSRDKFAGWLS